LALGYWSVVSSVGHTMGYCSAAALGLQATFVIVHGCTCAARHWWRFNQQLVYSG
jgi:hypothetical protein